MTDDDVRIAVEAYRFSITKQPRPEKWNERADHHTAICAAIAALEASGWRKIGPDEVVVSLSAECSTCGQRHPLGGNCPADSAMIAAKDE